MHHDDTYNIALSLGFDEEDAEIIANADANVDIGKTSPMNYSNDAQSWHFDRDTGPEDTRTVHANESLTNAIQLAREANKTGDSKMMKEAFRALGQGLHALQDIDAHGDWGENSIVPVLVPHGGYISFGTYDDPNYDWNPYYYPQDELSSELIYTGADKSKRYNDTLNTTERYITIFIYLARETNK